MSGSRGRDEVKLQLLLRVDDKNFSMDSPEIFSDVRVNRVTNSINIRRYLLEFKGCSAGVEYIAGYGHKMAIY